MPGDGAKDSKKKNSFGDGLLNVIEHETRSLSYFLTEKMEIKMACFKPLRC